MTCRRPCSECPWRKDTPRGQFPPTRYTALRGTSGTPGHEAPLDAPWFACHKAPAGEEFYCAGWMAAVGLEHIGVRIAVSAGRVPAEALRAADDWPELYENYAALEAVHGDRRPRT